MKHHLIFLLLLMVNDSWSQNLVRNPGFENKSGCPEAAGEINLVARWFTANTGTPDYFNDCSSKLDFGTEFNRKGGQIPHSGHGYIGLQSYILNKNEYFEYAETLLDSALHKEKEYCVSFWVSCGNSDYAFSEFGAAFSTSEIRLSSFRQLRIPYTVLKSGTYVDEQQAWICLKGLYKSKGGERFLTIGHFRGNDDFWNINLGTKTDSLFKSAYYFIDDVAVTPVSDSLPCSCSQPSGAQ